MLAAFVITRMTAVSYCHPDNLYGRWQFGNMILSLPRIAEGMCQF